MALLSPNAPDLMKTRLEQGVWLDQIERSYTAWFAAPNHKKPQLLLAGPTLTWAESWMLTQPEDISASLKQYIIRSLTAQSRKSADQREGIENEQRRKDKVYRYLLITMSLFAFMVLAPGIVRDLLGFPVDPPLPLEIAQGPDGGNEPSTKPEISRVTVGERRDPAPPPLPLVVVESPKLESKYVKLARAVQIHGDKGDHRLASLLAAEFFDSLKVPTTGKDEPRLRELSRSIVADTFATRTEPLASNERLDEQAAAIGCPETARFVGVSDARRIHVWNGTTGSDATASTLKPQQVKSDSIDRSCARLATVSEDYELIVTPLAQGAAPLRLGAHEAEVTGVGFSGDGSKMVSVSRDSVGKIWDARAGRRLADLRVDDTTFIGAALDRNGSRAVTWSEEQVAHVWDAANGRMIGSLRGHNGAILRAEFSRDGRRILTRSNDGTAILWDSADLSAMSNLRAASGSILDTRMSPDGRYVAAINEAGSVQIFDSEADGVVGELTNGKGKIRTFTFSDDGKLVATVDWSGSVTIWRTNDGERMINLNRRSEPVAAIMFSPDGKALIALTATGSIATWTLMFDASHVQERVQKAGYTCLTVAERRQFGLDPASHPWCKAPEPVAAASEPEEQHSAH